MSLFTYYYVSAALELFAAFITVVMLLIRPLIQEQHSTVDAFLVALLCAHALSLLLDAPIWILLAEPSPERVPLIKVLTFLTDLFHLRPGAVRMVPDGVYFGAAVHIPPPGLVHHRVVCSSGADMPAVRLQ